MSIGLNRQFDTPIGGLPEFRGNMQGGEVFVNGDLAVWDGTKFIPGDNTGVARAYGGLADGDDITLAADGSNIANWDVTLPLNGVPLQTNLDPVVGTIEVIQAGVYDVSFTISCDTLTNSVSYDFFLAIDGVPTLLFAEILGSNQVQSQSTGFIFMLQLAAGSLLSIQPIAAGGANYTTKSISFTAQRIG